jgi:F0F1-type ATP synthase assembly protein I
VAQQTLGWPELLGMGIVTAAVLVAGLGIGWLIDDLAGTTPIFIMIGLALGIVGAVAYIVTKFRTYLNNN